MYCDRCGTNLPGNVRFCPSCGRQFGVVPPPQAFPVYRVSNNLRTLAILWVVYSVIRILPGLFLHSLSNYDFPWGTGHVPYVAYSVMRSVGSAFLITGVLGVIAGWGLMERQTWARMLAIVLAFISLIHVPFGTAIGIYTLWVLLPATSEAEYQRIARP